MGDIYLPGKDVFSDHFGFQEPFSKILHYHNEDGLSLHNANKKIISLECINDIVNILDQQDVKDKIIKDIQHYRNTLLRDLDKKTKNTFTNQDNYKVQDEYFNILKNNIKKYPYTIALKKDNHLDFNNINFIKDLGNGIFSLRFKQDKIPGFILVKNIDSKREQYGNMVLFDTTISSPVKIENILHLPCMKYGENIIVNKGKDDLCNTFLIEYGKDKYTIYIDDTGKNISIEEKK